MQRYVIVVEHDLSVLDYLSDFICCLYGKPGAYGVVTLPFSVREGINIFLAGAPGPGNHPAWICAWIQSFLLVVWPQSRTTSVLHSSNMQDLDC